MAARAILRTIQWPTSAGPGVVHVGLLDAGALPRYWQPDRYQPMRLRLEPLGDPWREDRFVSSHLARLSRTQIELAYRVVDVESGHVLGLLVAVVRCAAFKIDVRNVDPKEWEVADFHVRTLATWAPVTASGRVAYPRPGQMEKCLIVVVAEHRQPATPQGDDLLAMDGLC